MAGQKLFSHWKLREINMNADILFSISHTDIKSSDYNLLENAYFVTYIFSHATKTSCIIYEQLISFKTFNLIQLFLI